MNAILETQRQDTTEDQHTLDLQISDPVSMLNEIARRYESTERILMEYVDNALDDAENLYRDNDNHYPYEIHIEVILDSVNREVTVWDNCRGMEKETLERIVRNVGESEKRGLTWVNGRFGFGVQAFRAAADAITFQTKRKGGAHLRLFLQRNQHTGIPGAQEVKEAFVSDTNAGTVVTVSGFEEEWFENITVGSIKREIESHFERLLARPNLKITVQEVDEEPIRCEPFQYEEIPGNDIFHILKLKMKGETYPIEVRLKIADIEAPGRTVRFFARGRRINEVSEIKSFLRKSMYKTSVWGHPHLLGYIEVGEIVRPVITRDDFVRNKGRQVFYDGVLNLENEIKNALDRINEAQRDTTLNTLESVLRRALQKVVREDRREIGLHMASKRKPRTTQPKSNRSSDTSIASQLADSGTSSEGASISNWQPSASGENGSGDGLETNGYAALHAETTVSDQLEKTSQKELDEDSDSSSLQPASQISGLQGDQLKVSTESQPEPVKRRRSGFDIQFFEIPPDAEGNVKRSYLVDTTIYINVAHPDFQERMAYSRQGQPKVTDRLSAYIAATVSIHYKDQFYAQYGQIPERRELLFDEQVDFIFRLESAFREHLPALERELAKQKKQTATE